MSARPSNLALHRIPGSDAPSASTAQIPRDAVVRITFANPAPVAAINGHGAAATLPATKMVIARVAQRTGDTLWVAVSQATAPDGRADDYPARGPRARLIPVPLDGSSVPATVQVLNANPRRAERVLTTGVVTFVALVTTFVVVCSQTPCSR